MNEALRTVSRPLLQLLTALLVGNICAVLAFITILALDSYRISRLMARLHPGQLGAVAGGWTLALRTPLNFCLLAIAFGIGMWLGVRLVPSK